jgi:hypothetical protein
MLEVAPSQAPAAPPQQTAAPEPAEHHVTFRELLSALNPLQYLPVVGTIYRAITGDQIPEPVRRIGSLIASGLMGGPIGVVINLAITAAEKISGIDLDNVGQKLLAMTGLAGTPTVMTAQVPATPPPTSPALGPAASLTLAARPDTPPTQAVRPTTSGPRLTTPWPAQAWSSAQLAAYGVSTLGDGTLKLAKLSGADVLNSLELSRIQLAQTAYDRARLLAA